MAKILVLDDEPLLLKTLARFLERDGHEVLTGTRFEDVEAELLPGRFDVLLTDIFMPGRSGVDVLKEVMTRGCQEPVVLITGEPNVDTASEAVRHGAFDYVPKPVTKEKLHEVVHRALRYIELVRERDRARQSELQLLRGLATIGESAAVLAHEIRSPLSNLKAALHAVADILELEHREVLEGLADRLERIQALMRRTLSFVRPIELHLAPVDPREVLESVSEVFRGLPGHEEFQVRVRSNGAPTLIADRQLIEEVLINLIQNAAEACARRGHVELSFTADGAGGARITVDDDGPGVPEDRRGDLFKLFHTTKKTGTGIGLAFCRKVIDAHGGRLEFVEGNLGGACFVIELRSAPVAAGEAS